MELQVAIDRVSIERAVEIAKLLDGVVPIIEMGTSLVKDYGTIGIEKMRENVQKSKLLVDIKTIDEGGYEFEQGFKFGGDILTVMGASSQATLDTTYQVTAKHAKQMMIDLLEVGNNKIAEIQNYTNAIYALHHSVDRTDDFQPTDDVADFKQQFPNIKHLAVAGGINLNSAQKLSEQGLVDIVIVGSSIVGASDIVEAAQKFLEVI
ncbi:orotidine 5'-phosphate decarboxylase / HUMPS family protein [Pediococcus claussenii]|uniref:Orotidine 5'-phosphate decarboxylase / HUMPS family protein n=1 Tax=Pediococcus claussenii (strain ATCC BAA-344 / DSM 14800 / JCM 18046 / KCTC 3811 / LMG 21948 / P06) TaxID=701521 RepID=G8PBH5_PEDCP|nr:orotidine 5'-phosphate decarboxylase / HUMPS family protein [Pediococcus claussenii]AEV95964.1 orotidine 5'-phosphate decarboxylase / HUMPS family protein [Pediococcus claussenii ATCC BAA-344]ANZ69452.1 3-hexulose-6-phosphate synthase [Pediococcus claussenii]ANZ71272.1 3-hexulose-6-phosphate synthase [Pediococcus claussenii]KRN20570.1 hypothetical protein IV79_GL000629 [Pediococcus claussenii]